VNGTITTHYAPSPTNGRHKQMPADVDGVVHCSVHLTTKCQFLLRSSNLQRRTWGTHETAINSTLRIQCCHNSFFILWLFCYQNCLPTSLQEFLSAFTHLCYECFLSRQVTLFTNMVLIITK